MKYIIKDWTSKLCFSGVTFDSFEEAWDYIYEHDPMPEIEDDNWFSDYYVLPVEEV
jgi:hypothetical protein